MSQHNERSDSDLLTLLGKNNRQGMELIFKQYYEWLCQVVNRILTDEHAAEDIVQEVFYDFWRKRETIQVNTSIRAYLRRAAVNKSLNFIRDKKIKWDDEEQLVFTKNNQPDAGQSLEAEELRDRIEAVIDGLPERCRFVFTLSRFEEMSNQEIADQLGISIKTVENQMTKALRTLKEALAPLLKN